MMRTWLGRACLYLFAASMTVWMATAGAEELLQKKGMRYLGWRKGADEFKTCEETVMSIGDGKIEKTEERCKRRNGGGVLIVKIATQSPLSGIQAALGDGIRLGTQLAIEQLEGPIERLGFKVEMVAFDDQAKPDVGVANAKNIVSDKDILLVIGHLNSSVAIPSSEVYKDVRLAMISPANSNPLLTDRNYQNVNRVIGRDDVEGAVGAQLAMTLKVKTAYVIYDKTQYGQSSAEFFRDQAKRLGIEVVGFEGTEEKSNFDRIIRSVKGKNPDLIYFGGIYDQAAPFFKQSREKGVNSRFMGPDGLDSPDMIRIGGKAVVGTYYTTTAGPVAYYPKARKFAEDYKARFAKAPEPYAAEAYDATAIGLKGIWAAIDDAGGKLPSRSAVSLAIRKTKYEGITGSIEFDEKGDRKKAGYFVLQLILEDPSKWADNRPIKRLEFPPPPPRK